MKQFFMALPLLLLFSCSTTQHTDSSQHSLYHKSQQWTVKEKDSWFSAKTISLEDYTTTSRKNGLTETIFIKNPKDPFSFYLTGHDEKILIQTMNTRRAAFGNRSLPSFLENLSDDAAIGYVLINGTRNAPLKRWEMILKPLTYLELNDNKPAGILRTTETDIRITAHNRFGKVNSYENICYEFQYRGQPVAAVIPGGEKPRVWIQKETDPELTKTLVAAIAALLLK
ncbi:hypothetical protein [Chitinophaga nivalis]|uniref:Lipoprotein n=1 Tax=Chitinophaga nivalis TaxID=2991709 RepID=A0ABT3IV27_9BACT|nr:hypothetical protein [Chitinophaga nivalis]MCW3462463.1 hypothetical protein [Chitinophaga nivalis]MCW3487846.1 hypothetical protein [Chitinophaga nivalis]